MSVNESNTYSTENTTIYTGPVVSSVGNYTPFYIAIAFSTVLLGSLLILNIVCCCSHFAEYWLDRHTGNRFIMSMWTETPHKLPPLNISDFKIDLTKEQYVLSFPQEDYRDDLHHESEMPSSVSRQALTSQDYFELQKRESDI